MSGNGNDKLKWEYYSPEDALAFRDDPEYEAEYRRGYCDGFMAVLNSLSLGNSLLNGLYNAGYDHWEGPLRQWRWSAQENQPPHNRWRGLVRPPSFRFEPYQTKWQRTRLAVMNRDGWECQYCGSRAEHIDHIVPRCQGGDDSLENLVASCADCNLLKGGKTPEEAEMVLRGNDWQR